MARGEPLFLSLGVPDIDLVRRRIRVGHREVRLTALETCLLAYLAGRLDTDVSRGELLAEVWGYAPGSNTRAVDFAVSRLRAKLGDAGPIHLLTTHGIGYRLSVERDGLADSPVRMPSGILDPEGRRFLPDRGEPITLDVEEVALLLRLARSGAPT